MVRQKFADLNRILESLFTCRLAFEVLMHCRIKSRIEDSLYFLLTIAAIIVFA